LFHASRNVAKLHRSHLLPQYQNLYLQVFTLPW